MTNFIKTYQRAILSALQLYSPLSYEYKVQNILPSVDNCENIIMVLQKSEKFVVGFKKNIFMKAAVSKNLISHFHSGLCGLCKTIQIR